MSAGPMGMTRMDRYIGVTVLGAIAVVLLAFFGLMSLFALLEELREDEISYTLIEAVGYVALTAPRRIYEVLPYVVFLGALIGLGSLASRSEIVVFRAAGVPASRIFFGVAWPAAIVFVAGFALGEWIAPKGEERAERFKALAMDSSNVIQITRGYWYREGSLVMRVSGLDDQGRLVGVDQYYYSPDQRLVRSLHAERADYVAGDDAHWRLHGVVESILEPDAVRTRSVDTLRWDGHVDPRVLSIRVLVEPRKLSLGNLALQIDYMDREGLSAGVYRLAFWTKILQPLSVLGLALLALGFILGPLREVGMGVRLTVGIFAGLAFKYVQDLFAPMSIVYEFPPVLAVLAPIVLCWLVGIWGLRRIG